MRTDAADGGRQAQQASSDAAGGGRQAQQSSSDAILCLHGFGMSGAALERWLMPVSTALHPIETCFIDGPIMNGGGDQIWGGGRIWWHAERSGEPARWRYTGVDKALESVSAAQAARVAATGKGFVGVLGFSQGAALASLVAALHTADAERSPVPSLRFAVLLNGFPWSDVATGHMQLFRSDRLICSPSLHVSSVADTVVKPRSSQALARFFQEPEWHWHDAGHTIPEDAQWLATLRAFVQRHRDTCSRSAHSSRL